MHVSRFEGFGLPVLEGLAHGAPVVCSELAPLREIAEQAALYVDPSSVDSIADGLCRIDADAELRQRLASAGHARARARQPQHTAAAWSALHERLLA